jgi:hypothetical protein
VSFVTRHLGDEMPAAEALQFGDEAETNAAKGAGLGGLLGLLLSSPLLTISGLGAALIAGPVAMGLTGAIVGGFLGVMSGWGVHSDHIAEYERQASSGKLLVIANGTPAQVADAQEALQQTAAEEVRLHAETSADAVDP